MPLNSRRPAPVFDEQKGLLGALLLGAIAGGIGFPLAGGFYGDLLVAYTDLPIAALPTLE
jgi:hypothetical protein